jgi:hypothetical protein
MKDYASFVFFYLSYSKKSTHPLFLQVALKQFSNKKPSGWRAHYYTRMPDLFIPDSPISRPIS